MRENIIAIIALVTFAFSACNQKTEVKQAIQTFKPIKSFLRLEVKWMDLYKTKMVLLIFIFQQLHQKALKIIGYKPFPEKVGLSSLEYMVH